MAREADWGDLGGIGGREVGYMRRVVVIGVGIECYLVGGRMIPIFFWALLAQWFGKML